MWRSSRIQTLRGFEMFKYFKYTPESIQKLSIESFCVVLKSSLLSLESWMCFGTPLAFKEGYFSPGRRSTTQRAMGDQGCWLKRWGINDLKGYHFGMMTQFFLILNHSYLVWVNILTTGCRRYWYIIRLYGWVMLVSRLYERRCVSPFHSQGTIIPQCLVIFVGGLYWLNRLIYIQVSPLGLVNTSHLCLFSCSPSSFASSSSSCCHISFIIIKHLWCLGCFSSDGSRPESCWDEVPDPEVPGSKALAVFWASAVCSDIGWKNIFKDTFFRHVLALVLTQTFMKDLGKTKLWALVVAVFHSG